MRWTLALVLLAACSRAPSDDPPAAPWKAPPGPAWGELPKTDEAALALAAKETTRRKKLRAFDPSDLENLRADASLMLAGEDAIASAYDAWIERDAATPAYVVFGTMHDSRAQIEAAASIVFRMRSIWGLALEQFRAAGRWSGAPKIESADDADLAALARAPDRGALDSLARRQMLFDHAAWKFGYLDAMTSLTFAARGAGKPLFGCDLPPELRGGLTPGGEGERALRELHCARALRDDALGAAASHPPDGGLSEDDPAPPEHFAAIVGERHAEPDGLARFVEKTARVALVRVLGGRPADATGDEADLASRLVVTDLVLVREKGVDLLLLPEGAWSGSVDRASDTGEPMPSGDRGDLPRANLVVTSDEPARFAVADASIDVGPKREELSVRAGHHAYVLVSESRTFVGAIDVPESGWTEVELRPKERALRAVVHRP